MERAQNLDETEVIQSTIDQEVDVNHLIDRNLLESNDLIKKKFEELQKLFEVRVKIMNELVEEEFKVRSNIAITNVTLKQNTELCQFQKETSDEFQKITDSKPSSFENVCKKRRMKRNDLEEKFSKEKDNLDTASYRFLWRLRKQVDSRSNTIRSRISNLQEDFLNFGFTHGSLLGNLTFSENEKQTFDCRDLFYTMPITSVHVGAVQYDIRHKYDEDFVNQNLNPDNTHTPFFLKKKQTFDTLPFTDRPASDTNGYDNVVDSERPLKKSKKNLSDSEVSGTEQD